MLVFGIILSYAHEVSAKFVYAVFEKIRFQSGVSNKPEFASNPPGKYVHPALRSPKTTMLVLVRKFVD